MYFFPCCLKLWFLYNENHLCVKDLKKVFCVTYVSTSACPSLYLSLCPSVYLSIYLSVCLFVYVSMYREVYSSLLCLKFWRLWLVRRLTFLERLKFCTPKCYLYIWVQECVLSSFSKNGISVQTYRATVCFAWVPVQFSRRYSQGESYTKP